MDPESVRLTPQRRAVLEVLAASTDHPTASEILDRVRERIPGIGPATVYRTLALLVRSGQATALRVNENDAVRYDRAIHRHDHVVCGKCGRVEDVQIPLDQGALERVSDQLSFVVTGYDVHIHGRCAQCAEWRIVGED